MNNSKTHFGSETVCKNCGERVCWTKENSPFISESSANNAKWWRDFCSMDCRKIFSGGKEGTQGAPYRQRYWRRNCNKWNSVRRHYGSPPAVDVVASLVDPKPIRKKKRLVIFKSEH